MSPADTDLIARGVNAINAKRTKRAKAAAHVVLFVVMAILGAAALVHFLTPCDVGSLCAVLPFLHKASTPPAHTHAEPAAASYALPETLHTAWAAGYDAGEHDFYMQGWRTGAGHGLLVGVLLGIVSMLAMVQLGMLVGA